jgi:aminoglycoside 2''-phosphotransferase
LSTVHLRDAEDNMDLEVVTQQIEKSVPGMQVRSIRWEGEGDFCRAYTVNGQWIFRLAWNEEGSQALEREVALLPGLAPWVTLRIPRITYSGHLPETGLAFVGYPRIPGVELTAERLLSLPRAEQEGQAKELAGFLRELHTFDIDTATRAGVMTCGYPFCRTEEGIASGPAEAHYQGELQKLLGYPQVDPATGAHCRKLVERLLDADAPGELPHGLAHGDLSQEHVLFDEATKRISGVIDFTDVVITTPLLDFVYLYHAYGTDFLAVLLDHYGVADTRATLARVRLLHQWYLAMRLLWTLEHDYQPGIAPRLESLTRARIAQNEPL